MDTTNYRKREAELKSLVAGWEASLASAIATGDKAAQSLAKASLAAAAYRLERWAGLRW